ncbi:NAD(P)-dependent alcohol dehydrogenase [Okibacterium endophyticum]
MTIEDVSRPVPGEGEILVRVTATTVGAADAAFRRGTPHIARLFSGLFRPRFTVLGSEFAGEVAETGSTVTRFAVGDRVFGATGTSFGAHADYVRLSHKEAIAPVPEGLSDEDAVALVDGVLTALPFLRDHAGVRPGQSVLVNGASGCVGIAAVQLAKHLGAHVTAVCSGANVDLVTSVGADRAIDYTREDFTRSGRYDVIFDAVGRSSYRRARRALTPQGVYLSTVASPVLMLQMLLTSRSAGTRAIAAFTGLRKPAEKEADLLLLTELAASGAIVPVIDGRYPLERIVEAHRRVDTGRKRGNIVVTTR